MPMNVVDIFYVGTLAPSLHVFSIISGWFPLFFSSIKYRLYCYFPNAMILFLNKTL